MCVDSAFLFDDQTSQDSGRGRPFLDGPWGDREGRPREGVRGETGASFIAARVFAQKHGLEYEQYAPVFPDRVTKRVRAAEQRFIGVA